jgi:putative oxidoreductase
MTNLDARLAGYHSPVLSAFRIIFGLLYTIHGSQKLFGWPVAAPGPIAVGDFPLWWAGLIEFVLGILITVGFFTRIAAFIASGEMAFAYFYQHLPPLSGGSGQTASFWPIARFRCC